MYDLISQNIVCVMLCIPGIFFVIMTYGADRAGRSGVPFIGGFLIALGFLTTPIKWLALLGMADLGYWYFPYSIIMERIYEKRFDRFFSQYAYLERVRDDKRNLRIWIPDRNEELFWHFTTKCMYQLKIPKLLFAVCIDKYGKRYMLVDRCEKGGHIEALRFDEDWIALTGNTSNGEEMRVEIHIVKNKFR